MFPKSGSEKDVTATFPMPWLDFLNKHLNTCLVIPFYPCKPSRSAYIPNWGFRKMEVRDETNSSFDGLDGGLR